MTAKLKFIGLLAAAGLTAAAPLHAQTGFDEYRLRQGQLSRLSAVFGELHHIRRMCDPAREANLWRERMKSMLELEEPTAEQRNVLVAAFNEGYTKAQSLFRSCDRRAENYAAAAGAEGAQLVSTLSKPLLEAAKENAPGAIYSSPASPSPALRR